MIRPSSLFSTPQLPTPGKKQITSATPGAGATPKTFKTASLGGFGAYGKNAETLRGFATSDPNLLAQMGGEEGLNNYIKQHQQALMWNPEIAGEYKFSPETQAIDKLLQGYQMNSIGAAGVDDGRRKAIIDPSGNQVYQGEAYSYKPAKENLETVLRGGALIAGTAGLSGLVNGFAGFPGVPGAEAGASATGVPFELGNMGAVGGSTGVPFELGGAAAAGGGGSAAGAASLVSQAGGSVSGIDKILSGLKAAGGNLVDKAIANPLQALALGGGIASAVGARPGSGPTFDAAGAAQAQGDANRDASWFDAVLNRPDQVTPWGSSTWSLKEGADPKNPKPGDWVNNVALDPAQQKLLEGQNALSQGYNDTAQGMLGRVQAGYDQPFDISGIPGMPDFGAINTDADRARIEEALLARLEPQLARDEESLRSRLVNTGFEAGSAGTEIEMDRFGRAKNDARLSAIIQAGSEARGQSAEQRANLQAQQQARQQGFTEQSLLRDRPLNELNALRSGSQVQAPTFQPIIPTNTQASPELDALLAQLGVQQSSAANKQSGYNALLQSLAGLGGSIWGGRP